LRVPRRSNRAQVYRSRIFAAVKVAYILRPMTHLASSER